MPAAAAERFTPEAAALIAAARRRTGLDDFGSDSFAEPLRRLVDAMREEAGLSDAGMQAQLAELVDHLCVSLRSQSFFRRHPEIADQEIIAPVVIVGLQRTGTSKLFQTIAADPQWNVLYTWLGLDPVPPDGWRPGQADPRFAAAQAWCEERRWMAKAHSFRPDAPEMEALLMKHTFMLNNPQRLVPSHQSWLETADFAPAYRYLKRQLQFLQWQMGRPRGRRWILKSPPHLLSLDALMTVFPDACLVMTHRHPRASVGSMFKLVDLAQQKMAVCVDRDRIRVQWLRALSLAIQRFLAFRAREGSDVFVDVGFGEFVGDPVPPIRRIYDHAGMRWTAATAVAVERWHEEHPQHSEGRLDYDLADYGATDADIEAAFADYLAAYGAHL